MQAKIWLYPLALCLGALTGYLDLHASEVQPIVLLLLLFTATLGFAQPRHAWRWGMILGLSICCTHVAAHLLGYKTYPIQPNVLASLLALIPSFIGAYVGAGIRWATFQNVNG